MPRKQVTNGKLIEQARTLRSLTGLPFEIRLREFGHAQLVLRKDDKGEPSFAGSAFDPITKPAAKLATLRAVEHFTRGALFGWSVARSFNASRECSRPLPERVHFCPGCGEPIIEATGSIHTLDVRESHECPTN